MTYLNAMGVQKLSNIFATMGWDNCYGVYYFSGGTFMKVNSKMVYHQVMELTLTKMEIYMLANSKRGLAHGIGTYTFAGGRENTRGIGKMIRQGKGINTHSTGQGMWVNTKRGAQIWYP